MIEINATYITRNNKMVYVMEQTVPNEKYPLIGIDEKKRVHKYTRDGFYVGRAFPNEMDLIRKA